MHHLKRYRTDWILAINSSMRSLKKVKFYMLRKDVQDSHEEIKELIEQLRTETARLIKGQ